MDAIRKMLLPSKQFIHEITKEQSEKNSGPFIPQDEFDKDVFEEFGERLQDYDFALKFYMALNNNKWKNKNYEGEYSSTFRCNANYVASLRGKGENYLAFYCREPDEMIYGEVSPEIMEGMNKRGWYLHNDSIDV